MVLHIFNPETDFAHLVGCNPYTPPLRVALLKKENALLPALYCNDGDVIIVPDDFGFDSSAVSSEIVRERNLTVVRISGLTPFLTDNTGEVESIRPWGWNLSLLQSLRSAGVGDSLLKSETEIAAVRRLAHRQTAVRMQGILAQRLMLPPSFVGCEFSDADKALERVAELGDCYLKAPWSSSGRGVIRTATLKHRQVDEWTRGTVKRQGSVVLEKALDRVFDFATEWECNNGEAEFVGYSVFTSSSDGRYGANLQLPQEEIIKVIRRHVPGWSPAVAEAQKSVLDEVVAPFYTGPLGMDMLADRSGGVQPCVELNVRMTMGHVTIKSIENDCIRYWKR